MNQYIIPLQVCIVLSIFCYVFSTVSSFFMKLSQLAVSSSFIFTLQTWLVAILPSDSCVLWPLTLLSCFIHAALINLFFSSSGHWFSEMLLCVFWAKRFANTFIMPKYMYYVCETFCKHDCRRITIMVREGPFSVARTVTDHFWLHAFSPTSSWCFVWHSWWWRHH